MRIVFSAFFKLGLGEEVQENPECETSHGLPGRRPRGLIADASMCAKRVQQEVGELGGSGGGRVLEEVGVGLEEYEEQEGVSQTALTQGSRAE